MCRLFIFAPFLAETKGFLYSPLMVVRMRHTRAHTANRRSHHALKGPRLSRCPECGAVGVPHRVCAACGKYRGRVVIDMAARAAKKSKKVAARKEAVKAEAKEAEKETAKA